MLNTLYADVFSDYYGDAVHTDDLNQIEWSRIPHFLRSDNFYVYQYSTSFVAATALTSAEPIEATVAVFDDLVGQLEQALHEMETTSSVEH